MKVKGYTIEDKGVNVLIFPSTTLVKSKVNGKTFEASGEVTVDNFNDLVRLNTKTRVKSIQHKETKEEISEVEYLDREKKLLEKRKYDKDEYTHYWENLDDEFNYRKFIASYDNVLETVYEEEEVIVEEQKKVLLDTNHPFIKSKFQNSGEISDVCVYNKFSAYKEILKEKMDEIGAVELPGGGFSDPTEGKLSWANSTHSCIRYAKFAGGYLFDDSYDVKSVRVGTFEALKEEYENDKLRIRKIIQDKYLLKFGKFNEEKTPLVLEALNKIEVAYRTLQNLKPMKSSYNDKSSAMKSIREAKELLNSSFKVE